MTERGSSKPPTLEWKASVASNLHQMVFKGVLHQLWIYSISLDLHPKVSMMWSLYNHNLKVQVYHNCSTQCHWIISSFISYESMKQNIKYHCTKWYIIEMWNLDHICKNFMLFWTAQDVESIQDYIFSLGLMEHGNVRQQVPSAKWDTRYSL